MSEIDLATAIEHRDAWLAADLKLATAQSYTFAVGGNAQTVTRADAEFVKKQYLYWQNEVNRLSAGRARGRRVINVIPT